MVEQTFRYSYITPIIVVAACPVRPAPAVELHGRLGFARRSELLHECRRTSAARAPYAQLVRSTVGSSSQEFLGVFCRGSGHDELECPLAPGGHVRPGLR